jgi:hypothetical protein
MINWTENVANVIKSVTKTHEDQGGVETLVFRVLRVILPRLSIWAKRKQQLG